MCSENFPEYTSSLTFWIFPDISLIMLEIPDFSRFSRKSGNPAQTDVHRQSTLPKTLRQYNKMLQYIPSLTL